MPISGFIAGTAAWPAQAEQKTCKRLPDGDKRPVVHTNATKFGAYDPHGDFSAQKDVATEALFLPWEDVELGTLQVADNYAHERNRKLLISIEPWSWNEDWRLSSDQLRRKVLAGDYDANIKAISAIIKTMKSPVIIRWGQEMEDKTGRFSWSDWPAQDYITAYKRVVDQFRADTPSVQVMWSPKGLDGLEKYYPGDSYVDIVGLSVFGLEAYDDKAYGGPKTFAEALEPGYKRVSHYGKPIWVAELGYEGCSDYLQSWMEAATAKNDKFPALKEVVYFNDRDVHPWPFDLGKPNWRVRDDTTTN
ncbi:glycoside hydrolase family 26 protein [Rhizobium setariae]